MEPAKKTIAEVLTTKNYFLIPVYQRKYTWKSENCNTLFSDVLTLVENSNDETQSHFLGTCAFAKADNESYIIIDGQQRLTTITLLLEALQDYARVRNVKIYIERYVYARNSYTDVLEVKLIHNNITEKGNFKATLDLESPIKPSKNQFQRNYRLFYDSIKDYCKDIENVEELTILLRRLQDKIIHGLYLISLTIDQTEDPQTIFQTINSTGVPLGITDLVKNYLLLNDSNNELYNLWMNLEKLFAPDEEHKGIQEFIRQYVVYKSADPKTPQAKDSLQLYEKFNRLYSVRDSKKDIIDDMIRIAKFYLFIDKDKRTDVVQNYYDDDVFHMLIRRLNNMNLNSVYPFVIHMLDAYDRIEEINGRKIFVNKNDFLEAVQIFNSYVFQQTIKDQKKYLSQESARLYKRVIDAIEKEASKTKRFSAVLRCNLLSSSFIPMSRTQLFDFLKKQEFSIKLIDSLLYDICDFSLNKATHISLSGSVEKTGKSNRLGNVTLLVHKGSVSDDESFEKKKKTIIATHTSIIDDDIIKSSNDKVWNDSDFCKRTNTLATILSSRYIDILIEHNNSSPVQDESQHDSQLVDSAVQELPSISSIQTVFFKNKRIAEFNQYKFDSHWVVFSKFLKYIFNQRKDDDSFCDIALDMPCNERYYLEDECIFFEDKPGDDNLRADDDYLKLDVSNGDSIFVAHTNKLGLFAYIQDVLLPDFGYNSDDFRIE